MAVMQKAMEKLRSNMIIFKYQLLHIGNGKDGERMANRTRSIVLRVPVTAEERALIEKKMQQISILFRYVIRGAEQDYL